MNDKSDIKLAVRLANIERRNLLRDAMAGAPVTGHVIECGVGFGRSAQWLCKLTDKTVHGFDSFNGLPEDWVMSDDFTYPKGSFNTPKAILTRLQTVDKLKLHIGLFEDTLRVWKGEYPGMIAFLHIDADLYSSCVTVLEELNEQIVPGTVIVFDEIYETQRYEYWEQGEYKAFCEWQEKHDRKVHMLDKTDMGQASFRIIK